MLYHCFLWLTLWTNTGRWGREDGSRDLWPDSVVCLHQSHGCWYFSIFPVPGTVMPGGKGQCRGVFASTITLSWPLAHGKKCGGKERKKKEKRENTRVGEPGDNQQREIRRISSTTVSCVSGHTLPRASRMEEVEYRCVLALHCLPLGA